MKRLFDILFSAAALICLSPILIMASLGIIVSSRGPIFYRATRVGLGNTPFQMLKFRTMHVGIGGAVITSEGDSRIFQFGRLLRKTKIDELPQFWNVLLGHMSLVGPRPEDPKIVRDSYTDWMFETLTIRPGITGQGSVYYYSLGEKLIDPADPETSYIQNVLTPKLALERAYMERANFFTDLEAMWRTVCAIVGVVSGRPIAPNPIDVARAKEWTSQLGGDQAK